MFKFFTKSQVEELRKQLATLGVRDTDLPDADKLTGEEEVAIVQNGVNRKVKIKDLFAEGVPEDIIEHIVAGKSAYEIAVDNGFVGTEQEWLASLKGKDAELTVATSNKLGGIKVGYSQNGKNYPVSLDGNNRAYVNVPWQSGGGGGGDDQGTPGTDGGYYELAFKTTSVATAPTMPQNNVELDTSTGWNHYANTSDDGTDIVWMCNRFAKGDGNYNNWQGPWRISGPVGQSSAGMDGDFFEFVYAITASEEVVPANVNSGEPSEDSPVSDPSQNKFIPDGWTDHPTGVSSSGPVEWSAYRIKEHTSANPGGVWTQFFGPTIWSSYGKNGTDGDGVEYIFYAGTELPVTNLPSSWTDDEDFQEPEYINENAVGIWFDDPVDLNSSSYGMGTKQWVCVRKKYTDPGEVDATWHAYSAPALWSYYALDGDAGTGIVADTDNDMITLSLKADGNNTELLQTSHVTIYNGSQALTTTITGITVSDSTGQVYTSPSWLSYSGNTITVDFDEDDVNLATKQIYLSVTASATAVIDEESETVERHVVIKIIGVHFGEDGVSYRLMVNQPVLHKRQDGTLYQSTVYVWCVACRGAETINSYTPSNISTLGNFSFRYFYPASASIPTLTKDYLTVRTDVEYVEIQLMYGSTVIDRERVYIVSDGNGGGYYESIFRTSAPNITLTYLDLPANGYALPVGGDWSHSAQNSDGSLVVWMASRFVNGDGTYENWTGPWRISGKDGDAGVDGDLMEYIYALTESDSVSPSDPNSGIPAVSGKTVSDDDFVPQGWTDSPTGIDDTYKVEWVAIRTKTHTAANPSGVWGSFSVPVVWSSWGRTGTDGDGVEYIYYANTNYPAVEPSSWSITNTEYQNTREYRATGSGWEDDPVDLDAKVNGQAVYPAGTKQWVCIRKKYADDTAHATFGTQPYWHAYSSPALWSYKAKDGDAGIGVVADIDNEMMAVALKSNGYNYQFSQVAEINLYNGADEVPSTTITNLRVVDSEGADKTSQYSSFFTYNSSSTEVSVYIAEDAINLGQKHITAYFTISGTVVIAGTSQPVSREVSLNIVGVHFGEDGASYRLVVSHPSIRKSNNNTLSPSFVDVFVVKTIGSSDIQSYTVSEFLAEFSNSFQFVYAKNNSSQETVFTTDSVSTAGVADSAQSEGNLRIELDYRVNNSWVMVDQETLPLSVDGINGDNAGRLDLDNENDSILYDSEGNKISETVVSVAKLYIGSTDMTASATDWQKVPTGCTLDTSETYPDNEIRVSAVSLTTANVKISCRYNGVTYSGVLSLKRLVGTVKYDLYVSPNVVTYDPSSDSLSSDTVNVLVYRTSQVGRSKVTAIPSGYILKVDGGVVTSSYGVNGYTFNVNRSLRSHTVTLLNGESFVDEETVPVLSGVDTSSIEPAVTPFRGEFSLDGVYYGSRNRTDIVYNPSTETYYIAKQNCPNSPFTGIALSNTNYWKAFEGNYENIATGFMFAERISTGRLETVDSDGRGILIENNQFNAFSEEGVQVVRISGDVETYSSPTSTYRTNGVNTGGSIIKKRTGSYTHSEIVSLGAEFVISGAGTSVSIPDITVLVYSTEACTVDIVLQKLGDSSTWTTNKTLLSSLAVNANEHTYCWARPVEYKDGTALSVGKYKLAIILSYNIPSAVSLNRVVAEYALKDTTSSAIVVGNPDQRIVAIGSNGLIAQLGGGFSAIITGVNNSGISWPMIRFTGITSDTNYEFGIMLNRSGLWLQLPGQDEMDLFEDVIKDIVNNM